MNGMEILGDCVGRATCTMAQVVMTTEQQESIQLGIQLKRFSEDVILNHHHDKMVMSATCLVQPTWKSSPTPPKNKNAAHSRVANEGFTNMPFFNRGHECKEYEHQSEKKV